VCVVALGLQYAMRMHNIVISGLLGFTVFLPNDFRNGRF